MTSKVVNMPNQDPQGPSSISAGDSTASSAQPAPGPRPSPSDQPAPSPRPSSSAQPAPGPRPSWHERLAPPFMWLWDHLRSPRTRLCVVGMVLLLIGIVWITNSVWTLPLIIVGIVMVAIAWVGSRLDGRFALEWGESGTQFEFRAQIKAPPPAAHSGRLHPLPPAQAASRPVPRAQLDDGGVIDGEGHTVEIDVAELKTLIRAAEAAEAGEAAQDAGRATGPGSTDQRSAA